MEVIHYRGKNYIVKERDEESDVAALAEWKFPVREYLIREFVMDLEVDRWISLSKLRECKTVWTNSQTKEGI